MKKIFRIIIGVLILGIFIVTMGFLYNKSKKKPEVFETKQMKKATIIKKTVANGSVVPKKEIEIKPNVSGILQELYVQAGQKINAGDLIAKVKIIPDMLNLNNAEVRLEKAKIAYNDAQVIYERQKKLYETKVIAIAEYQQSQLAFENAKTDLSAAEDQLQLIREGVSKRASGTTNTLIRSTITGMILDVPVKEGSSVIESNNFNAGSTIAVVADMGEMIFKGKVDETEVGKIKSGMMLKLTIGAIENEKFDAKLAYIAPKGVTENGAIQFEIKADVLLKENQFIRAGYSANADIELDRRDSVWAIQESMLTFKGDSAFVDVLQDIKSQKFISKYIKTGLSDGINVEVLSGITEKDKLKISK
jgi:HlyD family secretion protein